MPLPGFFAKQPADKTQAKIAEPQLAEKGVPPNVVMSEYYGIVLVLVLVLGE